MILLKKEFSLAIYPMCNPDITVVLTSYLLESAEYKYNHNYRRKLNHKHISFKN